MSELNNYNPAARGKPIGFAINKSTSTLMATPPIMPKTVSSI